MNDKAGKVIILATSPKSHGGVSAVLNAYRSGQQWKQYHVVWIATHLDGSPLTKMAYMVVALIRFLVLIPFYDAVHIHSGIGVSPKRKQVFFIIAGCFHKKRIIHLHIGDQIADPEQIRLYRSMLEQADCVVALSEKWKAFILSHFQVKGDVRVIYNPCPGIMPVAVEQRKPYIFFAGTINRNKGYKDLILAFASIASRYPQWKLVLAGVGEMEEAIRFASEHLQSGQIQFVGWTQGEKKARLYAEASVFCLPSYAEGLPMSVLEAWAYGTPVVCTPVGALEEIVEDGVNVLLFPAGDTARLAQLLEQLINNNALRESLAANASRLTEQFSSRAINEQVARLYADVLNRK